MLVEFLPDDGTDLFRSSREEALIDREEACGPQPAEHIGEHARAIHPVERIAGSHQVHALGLLLAFFGRGDSNHQPRVPAGQLRGHARVGLNGNDLGKPAAQRESRKAGARAEVDGALAVPFRERFKDGVEERLRVRGPKGAVDVGERAEARFLLHRGSGGYSGSSIIEGSRTTMVMPPSQR